MGFIWFWLVAVMLVAYVLLDGFDLGVGILHPLLARTEQERKIMIRSIGPVWDGNEVWLVAAGGTLYFAFPLLYASAFSGFYLALMIVLWLLIMRGASIELRSQIDAFVWRSFFDGLFFVSSALLAIFFGAALANVIRGVPLSEEGYFFLPLWTNWRPGPEPGILEHQPASLDLRPIRYTLQLPRIPDYICRSGGSCSFSLRNFLLLSKRGRAQRVRLVLFVPGSDAGGRRHRALSQTSAIQRRPCSGHHDCERTLWTAHPARGADLVVFRNAAGGHVLCDCLPDVPRQDVARRRRLRALKRSTKYVVTLTSDYNISNDVALVKCLVDGFFMGLNIQRATSLDDEKLRKTAADLNCIRFTEDFRSTAKPENRLDTACCSSAVTTSEDKKMRGGRLTSGGEIRSVLLIQTCCTRSIFSGRRPRDSQHRQPHR